MRETFWAVGASIFGVITGIILSYSYLEAKIENRTKVEMRVAALEKDIETITSSNWNQKGENDRLFNELKKEHEYLKEKIIVIEHDKSLNK